MLASYLEIKSINLYIVRIRYYGGNMSEPLLSVIIPVYQVEKYIGQCLDSVLAQTYTNLDIILVDDGGTDSSVDICREYQKQDNRIRIISQENGGLSKARNVGVEHAYADLVTFIDSDDFIHPNMFATMIPYMGKHNLDIISCTSTRKNIVIKEMIGTGKLECYDHRTAVSMGLRDDNVSAWGKIYKKELLEKVQFPVGRVFEDLGTLYKIFNECDKVGWLDYQFYHYIKRENSITQRSFRVKPKYDSLYLNHEKIFFAKQQGYHGELHYIHGEIIKNAISLLTVFYSNTDMIAEYKQEYKDAIQWLAEAMLDTVAWNTIRKKERILWWLYNHCITGFIAFSKLSKWSKGIK